jgi:hypothetical protein
MQLIYEFSAGIRDESAAKKARLAEQAIPGSNRLSLHQ